MAMKLSTGKVAFPIEFDNGDKDCIYFNPTDKAFRDGFMNFENSLSQKVNEIDLDKYKTRYNKNFTEEININSFDDILNLSPDQLKKLKERVDVVEEMDSEYQNAIKNEIDDIFKSNVSDIIFKYCQPLDMVEINLEDGKTETMVYILHFVKQFAKALEEYGVKNNSAMNKYMEKYSKK